MARFYVVWFGLRNLPKLVSTVITQWRSAVYTGLADTSDQIGDTHKMMQCVKNAGQKCRVPVLMRTVNLPRPCTLSRTHIHTQAHTRAGPIYQLSEYAPPLPHYYGNTINNGSYTASWEPSCQKSRLVFNWHNGKTLLRLILTINTIVYSTLTQKQFYFFPTLTGMASYCCEIKNCLVHMIVLCEARWILVLVH